MENIKHLQKLAEVFDTDKIITSDEIEQVLKGILVIMNSFKKDNQTLNTETKEAVEILLDRVLTENAKLKETVNRETSDTKDKINEKLEKSLNEIKVLMAEVKAMKPKDGADGKDADEEKIVEDVLAKIKLPEYEVYTLEEKGEDIVAEINALPTNEDEYKIDFSHIKNAPEFRGGGGSTARNLYQLMDVQLSAPTDNQVLTYDATSNTWKNENSAGGGGSWGSITGTLSDQTDLQNALDLKANIADLGAVAFSNDYNDLSNKPTIPTGTIDGTLTSNELVYSVDSNTVGSLAVATYPSLTEISYVKGVTSAIQTQLNAKETALTFSTGLTRATNTITSNISTGISGGQTIYGGIDANDDLTIEGTSHATKTTSYVILQPTAGNVGIGGTPSYPLDVITGTSFSNGGIRTKYALRFGTNTTAAPVLFPFSGSSQTTPNEAGRGLSFYSYSISNGDTGIAFTGESVTATSSTYTNAQFVRGFLPSSGNADFTTLNVRPTINQTGGANGITRGIYINPTLTSAADFRAIQLDNSSGYGIYQSDAGASNYFAGDVSVPDEVYGAGWNGNTEVPTKNAVYDKIEGLSSVYQPLDTQLTSLTGLSYTGNAGKFIRVNAGETDFELATVGGSGTVTSVALSVPTGLTISGSPITTTGTLAVALDTGYVIPLQTTLDGYVKTDQTVGQTIGTTGARLTKLWATDITVTNAITGSVTGNAGTVTNGLYTTDVGSVVQAYDADLTTWAGITPGTGVGTALAVNVGSAGAFVVNNTTETITGVKTMSGLNSVLVSSSGLTVRNPANTFKYTLTAGAIAADRTLNIPVITGTDTLAVLGLAQTFTGVQTFTSPATTTSITTGSTSFTAWAGATTLLTIGGTGASASMFMPSTLDTSSSTTGAIRTSGGISAAKQIWAGTKITAGTGIDLLTGTLALAENTSIALDPAGSADGKYSGITITGTGGATIAFGEVVYLSSVDSRWELADSDAATTADRMLGIAVTSSTDGAAITVLLMGNIRADAKFPALTIGSPVYVGETPGAVQVAIPTGADNVIRRVGFALTADELYFNPSQDVQTTVA